MEAGCLPHSGTPILNVTTWKDWKGGEGLGQASQNG